MGIVAIENPEDVVVISARPFGQRAVFKFAQYTGSAYVGGRYTPGTFTNQIQRAFLEPRLLIVTDPLTDNQPILEASYVNIPVVSFCDTDAPLDHVDVAIPCNNKSKHSLGLMYWLLAREVLRMRGAISRTEKWNVMVDLFMHREAEADAEKPATTEVETEEVAATGGASLVNKRPLLLRKVKTGSLLLLLLVGKLARKKPLTNSRDSFVSYPSWVLHLPFAPNEVG